MHRIYFKGDAGVSAGDGGLGGRKAESLADMSPLLTVISGHAKNRNISNRAASPRSTTTNRVKDEIHNLDESDIFRLGEG